MQSKKNSLVKEAHASREQAFALIFEKSFSEDSVDDIIEGAAQARDIVVTDMARDYAVAVFEDLERIDGTIEKFLVARSKARLSKVVLAVLRLSVYEILNGKVDAPVSINEAVELTKTYASDEEAGFVNGVLGSLVRSQGEN
ncbi:MAG: transcription antitermination factor NusB [Ruminococcaceae bacterium]|nr:transcription antitermination factor NusB [Oscillospiraceae bacterium]